MEEVLDLTRIQANSLVGFNKPFQTFVAFGIDDIDLARGWLREFASVVATSGSALAFRAMRKQMLALGAAPPVAVQVNVMVSATALRAFGFAPETLQDAAFAAGMYKRATLVDDRPDPASWLVGNTAHPADVVLVVASEDDTRLADHVTELVAGARGVHETWREPCAVRPDAPGHEHFGFNDGISQPGIRGLRSPAASDYFEPRRLAADDLSLGDPNQPEYAAPGRPLVWPGQFVFGYRKQSETAYRDSVPAATVPAWARNGSLCVMRRLAQDVSAFRAFVTAGATQLGISDGAFSAQVVGRWPSGAPLVRFPAGDPGEPVGDDGNVNNAFGYFNAFGPMKLADGTTVTAVPADLLALACPFAAHIRKVNPRDSSTDDPSPATTLRRRFLRRGIPYGPSHAPGTEGTPRGLLFVCYQTSIVEQFEFVQSDWMNHADRPSQGGFDLLVGQNVNGDHTRTATFNGSHGATQMTVAGAHIRNTGGEYLFSPSTDFLAAL